MRCTQERLAQGFPCEFLVKNIVFFSYIYSMKAMVITTKSQTEFKFINDLLKKLGILSATMTEEELEDIGLSKMLKSVDKTKKVSRESVMNKLRS
jgi:hypothetical protein